MAEVQSVATSNMEIENIQQESQSKLLTVKSINKKNAGYKLTNV